MKIFYAVSLCFVLSILLYMYFVSLSVMHVVLRKETTHEISRLHTFVSEREASYIEMQHLMSAEIALQNGFIATPQKVFIDVTPDTRVVFNN